MRVELGNRLGQEDIRWRNIAEAEGGHLVSWAEI